MRETELDGQNVWMFTGKLLPNVGLNTVAGLVLEGYAVDRRV